MRSSFSLSSFLRSAALLMTGLLVAGPAPAQTWAWARQTQSGTRGNAHTDAATLVTDAQGATYVAGTYIDSTLFGPTLLLTPRFGALYGRSAACVTQLSATGQWAWTASATLVGYGDCRSGVLAANPAGGVVVAGSFDDSVRFGATTLVPTSSVWWRGNNFVAQVSATGQWQWAVAVPVGIDIWAMAVDAAGDVVVAGTLQDTAIIGTRTFISRGEADTFVAKISPTGQWRWAVQGGGLDEDGALDVIAGPNGMFYVAGGYSRSAQFGPLTPRSTGEIDGYVAALDGATGQWQWVEPIASGRDCVGAKLVVDPLSGDLLVGGGFNVSITCGLTTLLGDTVADAFVARFSPATRTWRWATATASLGTEEWVKSLALDPTGATLYASGTMGGTEQPSQPGPKPIATVQFGAQAVTGFGGYDGFVARLDAATGQWQNATAWGGNDDDYSAGLGLAPGGSALVISGYLGSSTAAVGPFALTTNSAAVYPGELMVARLTLPPLGLSADAESAALTLAPNPATTSTRLTLAPAPMARPLVVVDALGRVVRTVSLAATQTTASLDLRGLPAGLYVVRVGGHSRRLVVE